MRWIAVRHGPDHIHLVAMLARQDGARVSTWNTRYRVRDACIAAEQRYGLRSTAPADRTASRGPTRAETGKAERRGLSEPPRVTLRRHVATAAATAASAEEFFAHLGQALCGEGPVQHQEPRSGHRVLGRAARRYHRGRDSGVVRRRQARRRPVLAQARPAVGSPAGASRAPDDPRAAVSMGVRRQRRRSCRRPDPRLVPHQPRGCCRRRVAAGDALRVTAAALGSRILRQAADGFDRAAREQYGRIPPPTPVGNRLRQAARLISAYGYLTHDKSLAPLKLIIQLAALAEAIAQLRQTQQRAHQTQAALRAATGLRQASRTARPAPPGTATAPGQQHPQADPDTAPTAAQIAASSFPFGPGSQQKTRSPVPGRATHGHHHDADPARPLTGRRALCDLQQHPSRPATQSGRDPGRSRAVRGGSG